MWPFSIFTHLLWAALPVSQRPVGLSTTSQFSLHPSSYFASIDIIFGMCIFICLAVHKRQKSTLNIFQYYLIKIAFKINLHFERTGTILISKITFLMCSVSQNVCSDKLFHCKHIVLGWARTGRSIRPLIDILKEEGRRHYDVTGNDNNDTLLSIKPSITEKVHCYLSSLGPPMVIAKEEFIGLFCHMQQ